MSTITGAPGRRIAAVSAALLAIAAAGLPLAASSGAAVVPTAINDPPTNNHSIIVFPDRDFIHVDGWAAGTSLTVEDIRNGVVVGTATGTTAVDLKTGVPGFDLNHLGNPCWVGVTPDVRGGDLIRVTDSNGVADQTPTANVKVTQPATDMGGGTFVEKGTAVTATGGQFPFGQIQARLIANRLLFDQSGKRDLRATPVYDSPTATTWTATWTGLDQHDIDLINTSTASRALWLGRAPGAATSFGSPIESTTAEFSALAGPAAGCTAPLAKGPSTPAMTPATDTGASATDGVTSNPLPTFTGSADVAGDVMNLYVDGVLNGTGTVAANLTYSLTPTTAITDGPHTITAGEVSAAGIETLSAGSLPVTIDTAAPLPPAVTGTTPTSPGSSLTPAVTGSAEAGSTVRLSIDACATTTAGSGTAAAFGAAGIAGTAAANTTTTFTATATDLAGNISPCSSTSAVYVHDGVAPPVPTITPAQTSPTNNASPSFSFSDSEPGVTFACSMTTGAAAFSPCASPQTYGPLADGSYTFTVQAKDAAGNAGTASAPLVIKTALPVTTIMTAPTSPTNNTGPSFSFTSEPGATFSCSMTNTGVDAFSSCPSPTAYTGLADGSWTFKVRATDTAGNTGPAATKALVIDTVAPVAVLTLTPAATSSVTTPTFDFASADSTATFQCSLTLATATLDNYSTCTSPYTRSPALADGNYVFKVRALDPAGNIGIPATFAFTVTTVVPAPAVTFTPATGLAFAGTTTGTSSPAQVVTLANTGSAALSITGIGITGTNAGDYTQTSPTCGASLAAGSSCAITVTFRPTATGTRTAAVSVADSATGSPHAVALTGTGVAPAVTVPGAPTGVTTTAGNGTAGVSWTPPANNGGATITSYTVHVVGGTTAVPDAVATGTTTTLTGLTNGTLYTVTVAATNSAGTGAFSTGAVVTPQAPVAPVVNARTPGVNATAVGVASNVTATFSTAVANVTTTTFALRPASTPTAAPIAATVSRNGTTNQWILHPTVALASDTKYTATLLGGSGGITSTSGTPLAATVTWTFLTGPPPTVTARTPIAGALGVSRAANVTATFSEPITGWSGTTVTLKNPLGTAIAAVVSYNALTRVVTLNPSLTLAANTTFTVTLSGSATAIRDLAGNPLATTTWRFTTGAV